MLAQEPWIEVLETLTSVGAEGPSFRIGVKRKGMLYFFLGHSDSCYMHVLMNSF